MNAALVADGAGPSLQWFGGRGILSAGANGSSFGGGTLFIETCESNSSTAGDWIPIGTATNPCALTANGSIGFATENGWWVRARLTGSSGASIPYSIRVA